MQILAPDILADARGLSPVLLITGLLVGLALWLLGWRNHRFWVVLATTVGAGIYALAAAPTLHAQPLVAALLLAVAGGMLALALVRLAAFASGGVFGLMVAQALAPTWGQPLVAFLLGGLLAHFLFRLWVMGLTSFCGTLLMSYTGLCLADRLGKLDAVTWVEQHAEVLTWLCGAMAAAGLIVQIVVERRWGQAAKASGGLQSIKTYLASFKAAFVSFKNALSSKA